MPESDKDIQAPKASTAEHDDHPYEKPDAEQEARIRQTIEKERTTSVREALRLYPKAVAWSILLSTTVIMEGYDLLLVSSFFAFQPWVRKYGEQQPDGSYELSAAWQSVLYNGAAVGEILGLFLNGYLAERFGYRKTMMGALTVITGLIFIPFFAPSVEVLQTGSILMGIPWGIFQTLPATYASEVCPVALRGYLTTYINLCWVMGQLLATGVLRAMLQQTGEWAYRIPYALQWMWPVPLIIGVALAPESPWWLVRKGNKSGAKAALRRLTAHAPDSDFSIDDTVEVMIHTNEIEKEMSSGSSYLACFKGYDLRRTEISCLTWAGQNLCGTAFMNNSTYFFVQAGMDESNSFNMSMGQYAIGFVGVFRAWFMMRHVGRRTLYVSGHALLCLLLLGIGFTSLAPSSTNAGSWAAGSLLLVFALCYNLTVGTVTYSLVSEVSSVRLRAKTLSLARNLYNVCSIVSGVIAPYMLNPTAWNWKSKSGFFWAGITFLCLVWAFFRVPETKGRTYAELDVLFEKGVGARKFADTTVEVIECHRAVVAEKEQQPSTHCGEMGV